MLSGPVENALDVKTLELVYVNWLHVLEEDKPREVMGGL